MRKVTSIFWYITVDVWHCFLVLDFTYLYLCEKIMQFSSGSVRWRMKMTLDVIYWGGQQLEMVFPNSFLHVLIWSAAILNAIWPPQKNMQALQNLYLTGLRSLMLSCQTRVPATKHFRENTGVFFSAKMVSGYAWCLQALEFYFFTLINYKKSRLI